LVDDVLRRHRPLEEGLEAADGPLAGLDPRERALARAIAGTTLRRLGSLRAALAPHLSRPLPATAGHIEAILLTGAAQLLALEVPDHAAVALAVAQARLSKPTAPFAALVNGLLRNLARVSDRAALLADPVRDVPEWMQARRFAIYGAAAAAAMAEIERREPPLDLTVKADAAGWVEHLGGAVLPTGSVRVVAHGPVPALPGYAEGAWWVQDTAAALPARLLGPLAGNRVADLCAAPGGKTAQLAAAGASVVAVDRSAARLNRLNDNLARLNLAVETVVADAAGWRPGETFDAVLLDAPCTATGTIRRHPDVAWLKRPEDVATLAALQARLLDAAVTLLRPGGALVYSTCSLEPEEGEDQITALLARTPGLARWPIAAEEVGGDASWINAAGELRTLPHFLPDADPRHAGLDGFFAARLVKS
jgi:16S rRNA (cytosine967-C5)-methyltransferase